MPEEKELEVPLTGHVEIPNEHAPVWLPLLRDLYRFESSRIAGPGSEHRGLEESVWDRQEVIDAVPLAAGNPEQFDALREYLLRKRQAMAFPAADGNPERYITRVGELVRSLGHTYEYWHRGRPGVTATRWLVEDKMIPERTIPVTEFRDRVVGDLERYRPGGPGLNLRKAAEEVCEAVAKSIAEKIGTGLEEVSFSQFQLDSTLKILEARYGGNSGNKAQVLTAGVGSGKTIGFSIAALIEARRSMLDAAGGNNEHLTISLFVYPRTQLSRDQHKEISDFAKKMEHCNLEPWLELYESYKQRGMSATNGVVAKYGEDELAMPVIVTTYETLKRRMRRPEFMAKISKHLSTVVLDEIHLTSGVGGGMSAYLLSRLSAVARGEGREIYWIGASATIARPDEHASRLFGIRPEEVGVIDPSPEDLVQDGINHHVFIRPNPGMSTLGVLVNSTSRLLHHRRDDLPRDREGRDEDRAKAIGFADNLEMLGRWNDDLRENERTAEEWRRGGRRHAESDETASWNPKQRELPYALRFHKPLQRRLMSRGGDDKKAPGDALVNLSGVFDPEAAAAVCDKCMSGERTVLGEISPLQLKELSKLVHRHPHKEKDPFKAFRLESDEFIDSEPRIIGSHDLCPMLRAGACAWFPRPELEKAIEIPPPSPRASAKYEFASTALSTVFSSKSDSERGGEEDSLSSIIFQESVKRVYDYGPAEDKMKVDIVLASPSLEVGVDLPMLTESVMHKAVRNIASYRQKAGRVGRESNLDVFNMSLMSDTAVDLHYYRQPRKLVSEGRLEPVPLMDENRAIKACSAYGAVWEWLALHSPLPEWIKMSDNGAISRDLRRCRQELDARRSDVIGHVKLATKGRLETDERGAEIIRDAINQVLEEIDLLLLPAKTTYQLQPEPSFEYTVVDLFAMQRKSSFEHGDGRPVIRQRLAGLEDQDVDDLTKFTKDISEEIRRLHLERLIEGHRELFDEISDLQYLLRSKALTVEEGMRKRTAIKELGESVQGFDIDSEGLMVNLARIIRILGRMEEVGFDQRVESLFEDYKLWGPTIQAYLSESIEKLNLIKHTRRDSWFVRPSTLFENPYAPEVELLVQSLNPERQPSPLTQGQSRVGLNEALFAFQPGTWTHRIPHRRLKVRTGHLDPQAGRLVATLREMMGAGNEFRPVHASSLPAPPGSPDMVRVWAPTRLALIQVPDKYVTLDKSTEKIVDKDEQQGRVTAGDEDIPEWDSKQVKIPRTFANRWTHAEPGQGEDIGAFNLRRHEYTEEHGNPVQERVMGGTEIKHPLRLALLDSIEWHDELKVIEYTYSNSRSYSSAGDIELAYQDEYGRTVAFGEKFTTEGFSLNLKPKSAEALSQRLEEEIVNGEGVSTPSLIKAFKAHVSSDTEHGGAGVNPYALDDLISVLLIHSNWDGSPISLESWTRIVDEAGTADNEGEVREIAEDFYKRKMRLIRRLSDDELHEDEEGDNMAATRAGVLIQVLGIVNQGIAGFGDGLRLWAHRTLLSTFGSTAASALQRFSGSDDKDMGYLIEPDSWGGDGNQVTVFDRAQFGNGSCATAKEYMHIPHVLRYSRNADRSKLPTTDYLSVLEEGLLQCMQHQSDLGALAIHEEGDEGGIRHLPDLLKHSRETCSIGGETWSRVGVRGIEDAWSLPLHRRLAVHYETTLSSEDDRVYADDVTRACTSCWNGCPECVEQIRNTLGGFRGLDYIDKYVLDVWFMDCVSDGEDYGVYDFRDIGEGTADMHLGSLNRLHLVTPGDTKIRSICLPWTMGFLTQRTGGLEPRLIMRHSDVSEMRIGDSSGSAEGIESHGFRRLLWFNLLMTGHLDSVGAIKDEDKRIKLLYFDARDISFQDVGLSPRMLDSMLAVSEGANLEKLSDVLRWMLERGFNVELCIDRMRASEARVLDFLTAIGSWDNLSIKAMPPDYQGNMHKKILISPIAAMSGSANLTFHGTELSQESISHSMRCNETQYKSLQASARTTFSQAQEIDPRSIRPREPRGRGSTGGPTEPLTRVDALVQGMERGSFDDEGVELEYKTTFCLRSRRRRMTSKDTVDVVLIEVASMLNTDGGLTVVGVTDPQDSDSGSWETRGIAVEIEGKNGEDSFKQFVNSALCSRFGTGLVSTNISYHIKTVNDVPLLIIDVEPSTAAIAYLKPVGGIQKSKLNEINETTGIWVRVEDSSRLLAGRSILDWYRSRFP